MLSLPNLLDGSTVLRQATKQDTSVREGEKQNTVVLPYSLTKTEDSLS